RAEASVWAFLRIDRDLHALLGPAAVTDAGDDDRVVGPTADDAIDGVDSDCSTGPVAGAAAGEKGATGISGSPACILFDRKERELNGGVRVELCLANVGGCDHEPVLDALADERAHAQQRNDHRTTEHGNVDTALAVTNCSAGSHGVIYHPYRFGMH